jgi:hypothetical protein
MVKDRQVKRLWRFLGHGKTLVSASASANMDEKTARRYRQLQRLPSEVAAEHTWRTRPDPFAQVWPEVHGQLEANPGLKAKTLFAWLQRQHAGKFQAAQLRTFQRGVRRGGPRRVRPRRCSSARCTSRAAWAPRTSRT